MFAARVRNSAPSAELTGVSPVSDLSGGFMNRIAIAALLLGMTTTLAAQQPPAPAEKIVAVINGETITKAKLDAMYASMSAQMRAQYDKAGGKMAFLDNYIAKRLLIQEALKTGFDKRPEVQSVLEQARESALFDRYVKDHVGSQIVTEAEIQKFYEDNLPNFATPEQRKVRHIVVGWKNKPKERAMETIQRVAAELLPYRPKPGAVNEGNARILQSHFAAAARQYSEDGAAKSGGELGWVSRESGLDATFANAAFGLEPGMMSGIIETPFGYHLIFVEEKKASGTQPLEQVRADIREFLMSDRSADVVETVKRLTNELRAQSKVALYPENVNN
jgi:peptidyl-prolyl cis-trans isomerase C